MRVAVLSDIHGNGRAFEAALREADARGFDQLILLGDLLTYGCDVSQIMATVTDVVARWDVTLLTGNHDQLYLDLSCGETAYYENLPPWLQESVDWTSQHLDFRSFRALPWRNDVHLADILCAHANPHQFGDWSYLNTDDELAQAAQVLQGRNVRIGVFGHTHRAAVWRTSGRHSLPVNDLPICQTVSVDAEVPVLMNAGSVGQPRNSQKASSFAMLSLGKAGVDLEVVPFEYDVEGHKESLRTTPSLSGATRKKLLDFF